MSNSKKIAVAMSGGVDSSVAAYLLKEQGFDVTGVYLQMLDASLTDTEDHNSAICHSCAVPAIAMLRQGRREGRNPEVRASDVAGVCDVIGIPLHIVDASTDFRRDVIIPFAREYSQGKTPNPCAMCNTFIKFDFLMRWIKKELGIEWIATGHYARCVRKNGIVNLLKGLDTTKDQSYFLFNVRKDIFQNVHMPLGELRKDQVREIAKSAELPVLEKDESQEICFIPDNDYSSYISDNFPEYAKPPGNFVDSAGNVLGRHKGTHSYTLGQRRGLGIGFAERRYVIGICPEVNEVVLGDDSELFKREIFVDNLNFLEDTSGNFKADVKIRYRSEGQPAEVELIGANDARITFKQSVKAPTPGQAAVFYNGDNVVGGGWIG